ncbi:hypothetical protein DFQ28_009164 [Apophysomyces sp. BC1034]|nr:hypothetical protein DFQ30_007821 [Apophysomyces sp. BC1015]KAG0179260.1 hypothetical protein DFQ29_002321 [Apophysomyces sp. BC1021]KAG0192439.1 hypothetical protein DFQ28_009164 [Apophysomyces sp. BC1034]
MTSEPGLISTSSSADIRVHPLSASPASNGLFQPVLGSPPNGSMEDVMTIFVVGFPDNMQEREFQNMFTFSPGFEAASLKWHCKDGDEDFPATGGGKKQMIGFARFRTRLEAMEAVEVLSGKKVDQDKGAVLKAEMAKKNLHIKRGSIAPTSIPIETTSPLSILSRKMSQHQPTVGGYDSFSPLPSDLLSPLDYKNDPFDPSTTPTTPVFSTDAFFGLRSQSFDARSLSHNTNNNGSNALGILSPRALNLYSPARVARLGQEEDPFDYLSKSSPVPDDRHGFNQSLFAENDALGRGLSIHAIDYRSHSLSSPVRPNPADQNPPCNTLYVGNLPPNTSEDELRQVFSRCKGYKRMCFRTKSQGPMCFVEFDDVVFATQAMNELQGHCLSNSVKGGIRLSFSKNPLFIKPNKDGLPTEGEKSELISNILFWKQNTRPIPAPSTPRLATADLLLPISSELSSLEFSAVFLDDTSSSLNIPYHDLIIGSKLGSGGFKDCFAGIYKGEPVAIGELRLTQFNEVDLAEVKHEIKVLKQLRHENVIRFIGVCIHPQHLCIITELCIKGDLFDVIRQHKRPSFAQQVMYMYDIALGVSYLHTRRPSIIHRVRVM